MNKLLVTLMIIISQLTSIQAIKAGDFQWMYNLNIRAEADSSGFRLRLASHFNIGDVEVRTVLNQVDHAADAYMVLSLGEISHRPVNEVLRVYQSNKQNGWGRMAKDLGIKPGSKEFHALKKGHSLYSDGNAKRGNSSKKTNKKQKKNKKPKKNKGKK